MKKAILTVHLVEEAQTEKNEIIEREILREASIPWCKEIEKVKVVES